MYYIEDRVLRSDWEPIRTVRQRKISKANQFVRKCLQLGYITKPETCEDCDKEHNRILSHHEDYFHPLLINWLCPKCHAKGHLKADPGVYDSVAT